MENERYTDFELKFLRERNKRMEGVLKAVYLIVKESSDNQKAIMSLEKTLLDLGIITELYE